jgi:RNA polymerase-associated protein CTR9
MKLGDLKSSLSNFENFMEVHPENYESLKAVGHIYAQQGQREKALEILRKETPIDPRDAHSFIKMGELLISSDPSAALDSLNIAKSLLKKSREDVSIELLNNIGVLHFERDELELAQQDFM